MRARNLSMLLGLALAACADPPLNDAELKRALAICSTSFDASLSIKFEAQLKKWGFDINSAKDEALKGDSSLFKGDKDATDRYKLYLDCMADRLPHSFSCSNTTPCIDIVRIADFSRSRCEPSGKRVDLAIFTSTLTLTPAPQTETYDSPIEIYNEAEVRVFDLSVGPDSMVGPTVPPRPGSVRRATYRLRAPNGIVRSRAEYTDAHPSKIEGLAFSAEDNIHLRNIEVTIKLPEGVRIDPTSIFFEPPTGVAGRACSYTGGMLRCRNAFTQNITMKWDWNMWERCPQ